MTLWRIATRLKKFTSDTNTPLYQYRAGPRATTVTTKLVTNLLRRGAKLVENKTGIPPSKISARSLRPGGATALLCAGSDATNISLVGRWRSEAVLRYLRSQHTPAVKQFSKLMLNHGNFTYNVKPDVNSEFLELPTQATPDMMVNFDPTDDASDDEDDP